MTNRVRIWMCVYFLGALVSIGVGHQLLKTTPAGENISESLWGLNLHHYAEILEKLSRNEGQAFEEDVVEQHAKTLSEPPILSHSWGIYPDGVDVTVTLPPNTTGYYSLDGSIPTSRHDRILAPIRISESTVLRVRSFEGSRPSPTVSAGYLVTDLTEVAAAHLVMDPVYLFNRHAGIYSNPQQKGRAWERPATLGIIDPATGDTFESAVRVRIHGNASRGQPNWGRKSFRITVSKDDNDLRTWLGAPPNTTSPDQSQWILRHSPNRRQLWSDRFALRIAHQLGLTAGIARPIVLYLNGKQWGIYNLIERVNEEFIEGQEPGRDFALLRGSPLLELSEKAPEYAEWNQLYRFIYENDLSEPAAYAFVESQLDIKSLIDYYALSIFMADSDRPQVNIDMYRERSGPDGRPGKWKFAVWDFDGGLNYRGLFTQHDTLAWHLRSSVRLDLKPLGIQDNQELVTSTRLLRGLMRNTEFRETFIRRFKALLATTFAADNLQATFAQLLRDYEEVLPLERQRINYTAPWLQNGQVELRWILGQQAELKSRETDFSYDERMAEIHSFLSERPGIVAELLRKHLDGGDL